MRAALYLRQSLDVQEGIDRQRSRCMALAAQRGWQVVNEYVDNDTSASKKRGPNTGWGRMLSAVGSGFDVVIAVDLDRLLRSTTDLVELIDRGARVITVDGELDLSTADGEFRATMLAGIARFEVRRKSERQKRANDYRAGQGGWVGGRRPFGYETDGLTLRPEEAQAVRQAFESFLAGVSLTGIAREWNGLGLQSGQGGAWRHDNVRAVLRNPRYCGWVRHRGEVVNTNALWPAIVSESTYLAVKAMLDNPARKTGARPGRHLLSGIAMCGVCGATVHAGGQFKPGMPAYRCGGSVGHIARKGEPVDFYVSEVVIARLSQPDAERLLHDRDVPNEADLHLEAVGIQERLDALAIDYADGAITGAQLRTATERLRQRLGEVERQQQDAGKVDVLGPLVRGDARQVWESLDTERKRAVISAMMRITLIPPGRGRRNFNPDDVVIDWI